MTTAELRWAFSAWSDEQLKGDGVDMEMLKNDNENGVKEWSDLSDKCDQVPINTYGPTTIRGNYELFSETILCADCFRGKKSPSETFKMCSDDQYYMNEKGQPMHIIQNMSAAERAAWLE